jgi:hypothetical protein
VTNTSMAETISARKSWLAMGANKASALLLVPEVLIKPEAAEFDRRF